MDRDPEQRRRHDDEERRGADRTRDFCAKVSSTW
jgi:hypothetical protein